MASLGHNELIHCENIRAFKSRIFSCMSISKYIYLYIYQNLIKMCCIRVISVTANHYWLTHWGRVTHVCVGKLTIIAVYNDLSPGQRQAIIWINAHLLSIGPLWTNFSEIWIEIHIISFEKIHLKMSSGIWRPSCLGLIVLKYRLGAMRQHAISWTNDKHIVWYCPSTNLNELIPYI